MGLDCTGRDSPGRSRRPRRDVRQSEPGQRTDGRPSRRSARSGWRTTSTIPSRASSSPTGQEVAKIQVGGGPNALGAAAGSLWVANEFDGSISQIDPATNQAEPPVTVGGTLASLASRGEGLWLAVGAAADEHLGGTLTVSSEQEAPATLDPAFAFNDSIEGQILSITNDGLLSYRKIGGGDGATLVPDLASALPEGPRRRVDISVPAPGRDRVFDRGARAPRRLPARTRTGSRAGPRSGFLFDSIEGADTCVDLGDPSTCDLSDSIEVSEEAVTIHLAHPDPGPAFQTRAAARASPFRSGPRSGTGASSRARDGAVHGRGGDADGIELTATRSSRSGRAQRSRTGSWTRSRGDSTRSRRCVRTARRRRARLDEEPTTSGRPGIVHGITSGSGRVLAGLGHVLPGRRRSREPPFDDVRVRQAVNYAIDRAHAIELAGGPTSMRVTCQILPPDVQGYDPYCPYTVEPDNEAGRRRISSGHTS